MKKYGKVLNKGIHLDKLNKTGFAVQEKLDGSNGSFTVEDGELKVFSKRLELNEHETLRGLYPYIQDFVNNHPKKEKLLKDLEKYIFFGEWLVKHKAVYKEDKYNQFYLFDVYDKTTQEYLPPSSVPEVANYYDMNTVDTFLVVSAGEGTDATIEEILKLVGKSALTAKENTGEGIVIKSLEAKSGEVEDYYKIVSKEFKENKHKKMKDKSKNTEGIADYAVTENRMEKMIFRAIEEGRLSEDDLRLENFSKVVKEVNTDFVEDIMTEEKEEILNRVEKQIKRKLPHVLRSVLEKKTKTFEE